MGTGDWIGLIVVTTIVAFAVGVSWGGVWANSRRNRRERAETERQERRQKDADVERRLYAVELAVTDLKRETDRVARFQRPA